MDSPTPAVDPVKSSPQTSEEVSDFIASDSTMSPAQIDDTLTGAVLLLNALLTLNQTLNHNINSDTTTNIEDEIAPLPLYTETAPPQPLPSSASPETLLTTILTTHPSLPPLLSLPLTTYPHPLHPTWDSTTALNPLATNPSLTDDQKQTLYTTQLQIITTFFAALTAKNTALVTLFITHGLVSPDLPSSSGTTPLLTAVEMGDGSMVCTLLNLGAGVNTFGIVTNNSQGENVHRTPLMHASSKGNIALVKLLMESFHADDALIAPDGQLALRLAADAGHREIATYLPSRRGGAWRRWKASHSIAVRRIKTAVKRIWLFCKVLGWYVPKFFVWDVPKHVVVKPVWKGCRYCWVNKRRFGGWCRRQVVELPGRVKRAGKKVWKGVKEVPGEVWRVVKEVPGVVERLVKWLWKVIGRIPGVMKKICVWIWESLKRVGKAVGHVFLRVVAALHTAVAAVLDFFRNIKLKDVWNGVCDVFDAIFRGLPRAIWKIIVSSGIVVAGVIIGLFGLAGKLVVFLIQALWYVVQYVPRQLGEILAGIWTSIAKGYHEIMVWINPKH